MTAMSETNAPANGRPNACTVYFDGSCPLCRKEIDYYQRSGAGERLAYVDVSASGPETVAPDLDRARAMKRFHVRRPDGKLVSGTAAFGTVWQQVPGWQLAGTLVQLPVIRHLGDVVYWQYLRFRPGFQAWEKAMAEGDEKRKEKRERIAAEREARAIEFQAAIERARANDVAQAAPLLPAATAATVGGAARAAALAAGGEQQR